MRKQIALILVCTTLVTSGCAGTYERTAGGALVGGAAGAVGGFISGPENTGKGAIIGIVAGALIGLVIDWAYPVK